MLINRASEKHCEDRVGILTYMPELGLGEKRRELVLSSHPQREQYQ